MCSVARSASSSRLRSSGEVYDGPLTEIHHFGNSRACAAAQARPQSDSMAITPNPDQFLEYVNSDLDGEVVMLNLLKFKESSAAGDGSGREAYGRYGDAAIRMVRERGGTLLWMGRPRHVFIGDADANDWDAVALVSYPSRQAFLDMVSTPEYGEAHTHREDGLERTVVIACTPAAAAEGALGDALES